MKKLIICTLAFSLFIGITACKKDNTTSGGTTGNAYTPSANAMSAKLDGTTFPQGGLSTSSSGGISTIYLSNVGASAAISVIATNNTAAGTYDLSNNGFPELVYNDGTNYFVGSSGSIVVSSNDTVHKVMKGTFAGTVTSSQNGLTHTISAGTFTMNYQ